MAAFRDFFEDDNGAITIDWVALTSGILLLGIMVVYSIFNGGVSSLVSDVNLTLSSVELGVGGGDGGEGSSGTSSDSTQPKEAFKNLCSKKSDFFVCMGTK